MSIGWDEGGGSGGGGAVTSVFGRVGAVVAMAGDYDAVQIDAVGPNGATNVQDALDSFVGETVWEFDFLNATTTDMLIGGPTYVVDSQTFTVAFQANASTFGITNGVGLTITANAGVSRSFTGPATDDAPVIYIPYTDLPAAVSDWSRSITLWVRLSALSLPVANNAVYYGLWTVAGTGYGNLANGGGWVRIGTNTGPMVQRGSTRIQCAPGGYGHLEQAVRYPSYDQRYFDAWSSVATVGPEFPANFDGMLQVGAESAMNGNTISGTAMPHVPGGRLALAVPTNAVTGAPSVTVTRMSLVMGPPQF